MASGGERAIIVGVTDEQTRVVVADDDVLLRKGAVLLTERDVDQNDIGPQRGGQPERPGVTRTDGRGYRLAGTPEVRPASTDDGRWPRCAAWRPKRPLYPAPRLAE
jgi:hypothetical protein